MALEKPFRSGGQLRFPLRSRHPQEYGNVLRQDFWTGPVCAQQQQLHRDSWLCGMREYALLLPTLACMKLPS